VTRRGRPACTSSKSEDDRTSGGCCAPRIDVPDPHVVADQPDAAVTGTDANRRTWLAAERTWLSWWRTGLGAAALAIGVGRILPGVTGAVRWPYRFLGLGYGLLAVAVLVLGAMRQQRATAALRRGEYDQISTALVMGLTAAAVGLATATLVLVAV
jgi:uncharacterized membrane protein YidH (DUF202 family)